MNDNKLCNSRQTKTCLPAEKCLTVVYKATITESGTNRQETSIGLTEKWCKTRLNLHKSFCQLEHKKSNTSLSEDICNLKNKKAEYNIEWKIMKQLKPNKKVCCLCLDEKYRILTEKPMLNRRKEIFSFCLYRKRFLLKNVVTSPQPPDESNRARNTSVMPRP